MLMNDLEEVKRDDFNRFILVQRQAQEDKKSKKRMTELKRTKAALMRLNLLSLRKHSRMNVKICKARKKLLRNAQSKRVMIKALDGAIAEAEEIDQFIETTQYQS